MAKIGARGATEVARIKTESPAGTSYLWVMCSDGRVLRRITGELGESYAVFRRHVRPEARNQYLLIGLAIRLGHKVVL